MAMSVIFVFSVLPLLYLPSQYKRWYKDITLTHYRGYITGLPVTFPSRFVLCCVFWPFLLVCFFLGLVLFLGFLLCDGIVMAFWTMYRSTTSQFCGHWISRWPSLRQLINFTYLCYMQLNVLNDLAKAKRRRTEKKALRGNTDSSHVFFVSLQHHEEDL